MNGIDKITGQISADIQTEVDGILDAARAQAGEIAERYAARAKKESGELLERGKRAAADLEDRLVSTARLEARKQILAVKQEMVARAFDEAIEQITDLSDAEYAALVAKLAADASQTGHEQVIFSKSDRIRFGKQVVAKANTLLRKRIPEAMLTLSEDTRPIRGGCVLAGEYMEINCSLDALVRQQQETMTAQVAQALFEEAPGKSKGRKK